ncbi:MULTISPECIES: hypothetical protein [Leptospira]|uniref:Lipoprotein n=1 Tax=Leptospira kirschneri serovar Pomona TaxID=561005 RepID=A0A1T1DFR9_9LEPT|nr:MULTISPECIES: hypothetical protein [Leptospira]KXZ29021.1 hypothetical protein AYB32_11115 [Leptospira kirschneri]KXZ31031.1 hypothetical protein AYB34_15000 [Leptospira sp. ZV016]OOV39725.1 hypothetical protein B1J93_19135 [Leptospira kirschneri serovar Pomona]
MNKTSLALISCLFAILFASCSIVPIKTVSAKEVPLNTKYKLANSAVQIDYRLTRVLGFAINDPRDYGLLTSDLQTRENCAFLKNVEFSFIDQALIFVEILTSTVKAQCWVKE